MLNQHTVIGRVIEVFDDREESVAVVKTGGGISQAGKQWDQNVACRFWGKAKQYAPSVGDFVQVDASVDSRKSDQGKWFTACKARYCRVVAAPGEAAAPSDGAPSNGNDNVPF